jgi:TatD DNase family protein
MVRYVDMHSHCYEYDIGEISRVIEGFKGNIILVCVSDDPSSSMKTIEYSEKFKRYIKPCVGIHPWEAGKYSVKHAERIVEYAVRKGIECLGEVGLDRVFVPKTIDHQLELFKVFLRAAREYDLLLNLHTPGTWSDVYELLVKNDINKAYFHWYTGPLSLIDKIAASGYYVGVNPAWKIQNKHRKIIIYAPVDSMITESDSPYKYKGLELNPLMIIDTIRFIADVKRMNIDDVMLKIYNNYLSLLKPP